MIGSGRDGGMGRQAGGPTLRRAGWRAPPAMTVASKDSRSTMTRRTGGTGGRFILHFCQDSY